MLLAVIFTCQNKIPAHRPGSIFPRYVSTLWVSLLAEVDLFQSVAWMNFLDNPFIGPVCDVCYRLLNAMGKGIIESKVDEIEALKRIYIVFA